eukprot:4912618-Amphidinium_carterae.4
MVGQHGTPKDCAIAVIKGEEYCYPRLYGFEGCSFYDRDIPPFCNVPDPPEWSATKSWDKPITTDEPPCDNMQLMQF